MAMEVHRISAEPGSIMKSQGTGTERTAAWSEQHSLGAQPLYPYPGNQALPKPCPLPRKTLKQDASLLKMEIYGGFTGIQAYMAT